MKKIVTLVLIAVMIFVLSMPASEPLPCGEGRHLYHDVQLLCFLKSRV